MHPRGGLQLQAGRRVLRAGDDGQHSRRPRTFPRAHAPRGAVEACRRVRLRTRLPPVERQRARLHQLRAKYVPPAHPHMHPHMPTHRFSADSCRAHPLPFFFLSIDRSIARSIGSSLLAATDRSCPHRIGWGHDQCVLLLLNEQFAMTPSSSRRWITFSTRLRSRPSP